MSALPTPESEAPGATELLVETVAALAQASETITMLRGQTESLSDQVNALQRKVQLAIYVASLEADHPRELDIDAVLSGLSDGTTDDPAPDEVLRAYLEADKGGELPSDYIPRIRQQSGL